MFPEDVPGGTYFLYRELRRIKTCFGAAAGDWFTEMVFRTRRDFETMLRPVVPAKGERRHTHQAMRTACLFFPGRNVSPNIRFRVRELLRPDDHLDT